MAHIELNTIQRVMLIMTHLARRPGYIAHPRQVTFTALERRRLVQSRPDPTDPTKAIWTLTGAGREWYEEDDRRTKLELRR